MKIKTVIWDFVGVLLQTARGNYNLLVAEALNTPLEEVNLILNGEQNHIWDLGGMDDDSFYTYLLQELNQPPEKKAEIFRIVVDKYFIDPELLAYIYQLKKSCQTILLTNFPNSLHDYLRTTWDIKGAFDFIYASCDIKLLKPDPKSYQYVLDQTDCLAEETIFIDDRIANVRAAFNLGIHSILFENTEQTINELELMLDSA